MAEDREPYAGDVQTLFATLRRFGGTMANARCIAYFVRSVSSQLASRLAQLDVTVKLVEPFDERYIYANKLRMLETAEACDFLVALDNDIVVCRDFADHVTGSAVAAKPADVDPLGLDLWAMLFEYFGLELPKARFSTSFTLSETIPYFNSGVLIIPNTLVEPLRDRWERFVRQILDAYDDLPAIADYFFLTDQLALPLALTGARLPYRALPLEMNFPTHRPVHSAYGADGLDPYLLHHHHRTTERGAILRSKYRRVNQRIAAINRHLFPDEPVRS